MAKRTNDNYPPDFQKWLQSQKVNRRALRQDPSLLEGYYREWQKSAAKSPARQRRRSLFALPKIRVDLNHIANQMRTMSELLSTIHSFKDIVGGPKGQEPSERE